MSKSNIEKALIQINAMCKSSGMHKDLIRKCGGLSNQKRTIKVMPWFFLLRELADAFPRGMGVSVSQGC